MMKKFVIAAVLSLLAHAETVSAAERKSDHPAGTFTAQTGETKVLMKLEPGNPLLQTRTQVRVRFTGADGKSTQVQDASVRWSMPKMGHSLTTKRLVPGREDGGFSSTIEFPMAGDYRAVVSGKRNGKPIEVSFDLHVMDPGQSGQDHSGHAH